VAAAAVVAGLVAAAPADAAKRTVPRNFYGAIYGGHVEDAPTNVQRQAWDLMASGGVESARVVFNWAQIERERGKLDWSKPDGFVGAAAARGMSLMPTVMYAPRWAARYPGVDQSPPAGTANFARFVGEVVKRYGPDGTFWSRSPYVPKRPVRHWQIWNEPPLTDHWWRKGPWLPGEAKRFGALLRASYRAVHRADPGAKVVLPGMTNRAWDELTDLYRHAGIRGYFDIAAVHMFPGKWRNVAVIVKRFRAALDRRGDRKKPIWVTEMTWPSAKGRATVPPWADTPYYRNFVTTEKGTAARLAGAYRLLAERRFRQANRLARVFWFSAASIFREDYIWNYSGLMEFDSGGVRTKPAYDAFRAGARRDQGCAKNAQGNCV